MAQATRKKGGAQAGKKGNGRLLAIGAGAVLVVGLIVWRSVGGGSGAAATSPLDLSQMDDRELIELARGVESGNEAAAVWLLEFADFQCPSCAQFAQAVKPLVDLNYVESGRIRFVFHDFPIVNAHPNSFLASRSARCADDLGGFWSFHDELYRNQGRWASSANPIGLFVDYAERGGLDKVAFEQCVRSDRFADVVSANRELGIRLGVPGTPAVMIRQDGGMAQRVGSWDYNSLSAALDAALANAGTESGAAQGGAE